MVKHLAIIMDGNGRWAEARGLERTDGHRAGAKQISKVVEAARKFGIESLTVYAFSTENWRRPAPEVGALMDMVKEFTTSQLPDMMKNNVRLRTIGRTSDLPLASRSALLYAVEKTAANDGFTLNIALSYGGRAELVDAVNAIVKDKNRPEVITEENLRNYLYAGDIPDPDLLIRTGGEMRISNFLLWQIAYTELYVTERFWPEFDEDALKEALDNFAKRNRRFGGLNKK
jgi:undecaprenyl diphosphate synthase